MQRKNQCVVKWLRLAAEKVKVGGEELVVMREDDIMAIIEK